MDLELSFLFLCIVQSAEMGLSSTSQSSNKVSTLKNELSCARKKCFEYYKGDLCFVFVHLTHTYSCSGCHCLPMWYRLFQRLVKKIKPDSNETEI